MNWFGAGREKLAEELRKASTYTRSLIEASLDPLVTISAGRNNYRCQRSDYKSHRRRARETHQHGLF